MDNERLVMTSEYYNGSIDEFNKYNLTSTYMGTWPQLHFDEWVTAHLIEFHTSYGPWMEDYERILCHFMRYSSTLKSIQNTQRKPFYDLFGKSMSLIMRIRYDIINKIDNENINNIHVECNKIDNINLEQCIYLLNCFLKDTKAVIKKRELKLLKQSALKNANLWICKVCNKMVDKSNLCEICCYVCYQCYHGSCAKLFTTQLNQLKTNKFIFLCEIHSDNGTCSAIDKKKCNY